VSSWKYLAVIVVIVASFAIASYMEKYEKGQHAQAIAALQHAAESEESLNHFVASMTTEEKIGQMIQVERFHCSLMDLVSRIRYV
jgi:Tfp pilus assembly protein PilE